MKTYFLLVILAIIFSISSCSKNDDSLTSLQAVDPDTGGEIDNDSIVYFSINVNPYWLNDQLRSTYIVINDPDGTLIDHQKVENDTRYEFKIKKEDVKESYTITRFIDYLDELGTYRVTAAQTYYNIEKGSIWNLNAKRPNTNGSGNSSASVVFNFKVENIEGWSDHFVHRSDGFAGFVSNETPTSLEYMNVALRENEKLMLTIHFDAKSSKYVFIDPPNNDNVVTIDGSSLLDFDSFVNINVPNDGNEYNKTVFADYLDLGTFFTSFNTKIISSKSDKIGLLDSFNNYEIQVFTKQADHFNLKLQRYMIQSRHHGEKLLWMVIIPFLRHGRLIVITNLTATGQSFLQNY